MYPDTRVNFRVRAFTLVEVTVAIVVMAILGSTGALLTLSIASVHSATSRRAALHVEASIALDRIVRELQRIPLNPDSASGGPLIESAETDAIAWGESGSAFLELTDGMLSLRSPEDDSGGILVSGVSSFSLTYFDESNSQVNLIDGRALTAGDGSVDPVRRIAVHLQCDDGDVKVTLRTRVFIRSLMEGS